MSLNFHCNPRFTACLALAMLSLPLRSVALSHPTPLRHRARASAAAKPSSSKPAAHKTTASKAVASRAAASRAVASKAVASRAAASRTLASRPSTTASSSSLARTTPAAIQIAPPARRGFTSRMRTISGTRALLALRSRLRRGPVERFTANSFTDTLTLGDSTAGEDPVVRAAAIQALGNLNGTALAIDPSNGRILAMVNQKLALSGGAEPCSTIKLAVTLAALDEGLIKRDTPVNLGGHYTLTLTPALAHSINPYFETLGRRMGFERVKYYANQFGLGELAGYNIPGEQLGVYPESELPAAQGGVGRMCSFGEGISMTPLQLGALVSAIANGGTLYYLQHPETPGQIANFQPKVKRTLDIAPLIPEMRDGMEGTVDYGTGRSLRSSFREFPVLGKTGTCSNNGTRFGWFASYADTPNGRIVTVVFLEGGRPMFGPKAAEITGQLYRALWDSNYFDSKSPQLANSTHSLRSNP
jgi:penicillin-binding protein 2